MRKQKIFYIQYRRRDSNVWLGLNMFRCEYVLQAIQMSRQIFIENWNLAFPDKADGVLEVRNYIFEEYGK